MISHAVTEDLETNGVKLLRETQVHFQIHYQGQVSLNIVLKCVLDFILIFL